MKSRASEKRNEKKAKKSKEKQSKSANAEIGAPGKRFKLDEGLNDLFAPLFQAFFYLVHELMCRGAIDHAVIVGEREIYHRTNRDGIVNHHGAFLNCADAQNRYVGLVDHRQSH